LSNFKEVCGCDVLDILKASVVSVIEDHGKSCLYLIYIDLVSLGDLPNDFKTLFTKLMVHVYGLKSKSRELVLKVLKLFADYDNSSDDPIASLVIHTSSEHDNVVHEAHVPEV
jgi:hypothetical protein